MTVNDNYGFYLMMIFSAIDGNISEKEVLVIQRYLHGWEHEAPDSAYILDFLNQIMKSGVYELFNKSVIHLSQASHKKERELITNFVTETIMADGYLSPNEKWLFAMLKNYWDIKLPDYLQEQLDELTGETDGDNPTVQRH